MESVLIIDDEADIRDILAYNLKKEGFTVYTASNGKDGIEIARTSQPDIVILDVMMPEMDGLSFSEKVKEINSDIPIIILTANKFNDADEFSKKHHVKEYLTKPFEMSSMMETIAKYIG